MIFPALFLHAAEQAAHADQINGPAPKPVLGRRFSRERRPGRIFPRAM